MLVLTRKVGEGIAIGDDVKIIVMQVKGKQVRLGIKADASTTVHREEIWQKIQEENKAAAASSSKVGSALDAVSALFGNSTKPKVNEDGKPGSEPAPKRAPLRRHVRPNRDE